MTLARRKTCIKQITGQKSVCHSFQIILSGQLIPQHELWRCVRALHVTEGYGWRKKSGVRKVEWYFPESIFIPPFRPRFSTDCRAYRSFVPALCFTILSFSQAFAATHNCDAQRGQRAHRSMSLRYIHRPKIRYYPVREPEFLRITLRSF